MSKFHLWVSMLPLSAALAGCALEKTSTPLSPSVAGPIPGVGISAPSTMEPAQGSRILDSAQPLTLVVENATTTGVRPLSYSFEVATDGDFNQRVFHRDGVTPGEGGRTSVRLPDRLASGRTYYWRSRAGDGANAGPYSNPTIFTVYTPVVLDKPVLVSPANNDTLQTLQPSFRFNNAPRSGPAGAIYYEVQLSQTSTFATITAIWQVSENPGQTGLSAPIGLTPSTQYFWRARAFEQSVTGPFSDAQAFRTYAPVVVAPTPTPAAPSNCTLPGPTPYDSLVCARNAYPHPMNSSHRGALMNQVAWLHRDSGLGMHRKDGGNRCPQPRTGISISCDILVDRNGIVYDVLIDEEIPTWGYKGPINSMSNFVSPVQP
jgi:hypothetical protein